MPDPTPTVADLSVIEVMVQSHLLRRPFELEKVSRRRRRLRSSEIRHEAIIAFTSDRLIQFYPSSATWREGDTVVFSGEWMERAFPQIRHQDDVLVIRLGSGERTLDAAIYPRNNLELVLNRKG